MFFCEIAICIESLNKPTESFCITQTQCGNRKDIREFVCGPPESESESERCAHGASQTEVRSCSGYNTDRPAGI